MTSRGSAPSMTAVIAARASETTFEARSLIGISSIRIAGGISGRTSRMRRSSVGRIMVCVYADRRIIPRRMYKWTVVALLWLVCFFNYADRQAIYSVFPLLKTEMGLSDVQLGVVWASFMWVYAAAAPLAGIAGDRWARKTIVVGGLIFWSLITVATALSTQYSHLVVCRALEGLGEAFYFPASMSLLSDYHAPATRSRAMSIHQSSVYAGTIAGGTVAGVMGQALGWRSSFYLFGTLGAALGLVLIVFLREPARERIDEPDRKST